MKLFYRISFLLLILAVAFYVSWGKGDFSLSLAKIEDKQVVEKVERSQKERSSTRRSTPLKLIDTVPSTPGQPLATSISAIKTVDKATAVAGDTLTYEVKIRSTGAEAANGLTFTDAVDANTTLIADSLRYSPIAIDESYSSLGNVGITVPAANGVLQNDYKGLPIATLSPINRTTANGGNIVLNADGSFAYSPAAGYTGTDTVRYIIENRVKRDTGVLSIVVTTPVWFINNNYSGAIADGRMTTPFKSVAAFQAVNNGSGSNPKAGQVIFLHESATAYDGNITLLNGQKLIGQDATTTIAAIAGLTIPAYSNALPVLNSSNGITVILTSSAANTNTVTLAAAGTNYLVRGLSIGNRTGAGITGNNFGSLTLSEANISGTGQALVLSNGELTATLGTLTSTSGAYGISLANITGSLTAASGAISNSTTTAFHNTGGNANITYPGNIQGARPLDIQNRNGGTVTLSGDISSTNQGINISGNTGGTITLSGATKTLNTGANAAVNLANNNGTTISFSGGLSITTTTGAGFNAIGGAAAITVTGSNNTISSTTGTALNIANSMIGAAGLTFRSISVNGGTKGISLNNTGGNGGLTITGIGTTAGSGGTIQNTSSRGIEIINARNISLSNINLTNANTTDGSNCTELDNQGCNAAVYLGTVTNAMLNRLTITNTAQQGINANNVTALTIDNTTVTGNGNGLEEGALKLKDLQGTCNILNSTFSNSYYRIAHLLNTTGAMNLHITNSNFVNTTTLSPIAQDCFEMRTKNTATATVVITGSTFRRAGTKGIQVFAENNSQINLAITGCTVDRQGGMMAGIEVGSDQSAKMFANVDNNPIITGSNEVALNIYAGGMAASRTEATVRNNASITGNGLGMYTDPTVQAFANEGGNGVVLIQGNTVANTDDQGILARSTEGAGAMNATVMNNSVTVPAASLIGIEIRSGSDETTPFTNTTCANVRSNTVNNSGAYAFFVQAVSPGTKVQLQGSGADVPSLWAGNLNTGSPVDVWSVPGAQVLIGPGYVCTTPTNLTAPTIALPVEDGGTSVAVEDAVPATDTVALVSNTPSPETITTTPSTAANKESSSLSGETVAVSGIDLPVGKTLVIQFEVQVNSAFPVNVCSVSNQGTVSGANFANTLTDNDGNTGNGVNPTVTTVNAAPLITACQAAITATTATCTSLQSFSVTATGCPAPTMTYTIQGSGTVITSPYAFPVGVTTVNVTASNGIGADATCSFTVTVTGTNATWTGTTSSDWHTAANWSCGAVPDITTNATINSGAPNMPVIGAAAAAKNITLGTGASLTISTGNTLQVDEDFTSNGNILANGTVAFVGTGVQSIPAATYNNLTISGGSNKNLAGTATINGVLSFTAGTLSLGNYDLVLGGSNTISGATATSFLVTDGNGRVKKQGLGSASGDYTFPVGYSVASYTPVTLSNAGTTDNFSVRVINNVYSSYAGTTPQGSPISSGVVNKTWFVEEDLAGGSDVTLTLQWNSADELPGFSRFSSYVSHNANNAWLAGPAGAAAGSDPYTRFRANIMTFSPFGVGSTGSLLPVQLLTFKGAAKGSSNELEWTTASEQLVKFEVERSAAGGFVKIGEVKAKGSTSFNSYSFSDDQPAQGTNVYRLKMLHPDGKTSYSSTIRIARGMGQPMVSAYPSPVTDGKLTVQMSNLEKGNYTVSLYNNAGQLAYTTTIQYDGGALAQVIQLPAMTAKGLYHLQVQKDGQQFRQTIAIQ